MVINYGNYHVESQDLCPCGSGVIYSECCKKKDNTVFVKSYNKCPKGYRIAKVEDLERNKMCLYPGCCKCGQDIINSHAIQKNKILIKISENNKVVMPNSERNFLNVFGKPIHIKKATTFNGFCNEHDKIVFQDIEDCLFSGTQKQVFLYCYRAFTYEYILKIYLLNLYQNLFKNCPSKINDNDFMNALFRCKAGVEEFKRNKIFFDEALLSGHYDIFESIIWEWDYPINFCFTGYQALDSDFDGNFIQHMIFYNNEVAHLYFMCFPEEDKSYSIIGVLKNHYNLYESTFDKLKALGKGERINYLNNVALATTDNLAISPSSWDKLRNKQKDILVEKYKERTDLYPSVSFIREWFNPTPYNLFEI